MNEQEIAEQMSVAWALAKRLELCKGRAPRLKIRWSQKKSRTSGRAFRQSFRIVLTVGANETRGNVTRVLLHEVSHLTDGGFNHGPGFKRNFNWLFAAFFGLPPVQFSGPMWRQGQQASELARAMYGEQG